MSLKRASGFDLSGLRSDEAKQAIAVRAAIRSLPGILSIGTGPWEFGRMIERPIAIQAARCLIVAWTSFAYKGVSSKSFGNAFDALENLLRKFDCEFTQYYEKNFIGSDYGFAANQNAAEAGRRCPNLVIAARDLCIEPMEFDKHRLGDRIFDTRRHIHRWTELQQRALDADIRNLRGWRSSNAKFIHSPLWPDAESAALETQAWLGAWRQLGSREWLGSGAEHFFRERKDGVLVLGKPPLEQESRMVAIANLPGEFWQVYTEQEEGLNLDAFSHRLSYAFNGDTENEFWGSARRPDLKLGDGE